MNTKLERSYQAALLADAAYVTFNADGYIDGSAWADPDVQSKILEPALNGSATSEEIPFGEVEKGREWTRSRFAAFTDRYSVVYHQPDSDNGFSATLFYDQTDDRYTVAFRGTNEFLEPDVVPSDLWLALGFSSSFPDEQHSSIADFLEAAGLVDANGIARPEYTGKVDFVGHSLGGYLSLWAMYEFRDLFNEVYTFNGAGISALPGTPDYNYISKLIEDHPLGTEQQGRIYNFFAEEGPELTANDLTFFRPGQREGVFIERKDLLGTVGFHSVSLLVDALSVYSLFAMIDEDVAATDIKNALYSISNISLGSLDRTVAELSRLVAPAEPTTTLADVDALRDSIIAAMGDKQSLGAKVELLDTSDPDGIAAVAAIDSDRGRGFRYALDRLLPFGLIAAVEQTAVADSSYDLANFSRQYLADRALMLTALTTMNTADAIHGDLAVSSKFSDLGLAIGFDGDGAGYDGGNLSDPLLYDHNRARYVFGSQQGDDTTAIIASRNDDHLYGMGGDDTIDGGDGSDYIEGGTGNDTLYGGELGDDLLGGDGSDLLDGGRGDDRLLGGHGADRFLWRPGDGYDVIGDYDEGGDRIWIDGVDLATLQFRRMAADSPYYLDPAHPDITLHYDGGFLAISAGSDAQAGGVLVTQYAPAVGADYGILLRDYQVNQPVTDISVISLGSSDLESDEETRANAYDRQSLAQRGLDWATISINFDAAVVSNYSAGTLHGTAGGAFEGGPLGDRLAGDDGANALHGLAGDDLVLGGAGDDFLEGGAGADVLTGGEGSDLIFASARAGLAATLDTDSPVGRFYLSQIGDEPEDVNRVDGGPGDDFASGGQYTDYLDGGTGSDYLLGGTGRDFIEGGADRDIIYGDSALDYRYVELTPGVAGEQLGIAFAGAAEGAGNHDDVIHAGAGDDTVWGELGDDTLFGGAGDDNLVGDRYNDTAYFAAELPAALDTTPELAAELHGEDRLFGGPGSDLLLGLGGDDLLAGGEDADSLAGGAGDDTYLFVAGDGLDVVDDVEGRHTLLFAGVDSASLQVLFQGDQVFVGSGYGADGFYLSRDEWANVQIALDTPDGQIERSRLDSLYFDAAGTLLFKVNGTSTMAEAARDALFTVDDSDPERPAVVVGPQADQVIVEALAGDAGGGTLRVIGGGLQLVLELTAAQLASGLDFLSLADNVSLSTAGLSGDVFGSSGADHLRGSDGADSLHGSAGDDLLEGLGGSDYLDGGAGFDTLRGGTGSDTLDGGHGPDTYVFAAGDGRDQIRDAEGYSYLQFDSSVAPDSLALYFTGTTDSRFRVEYGAGDAVESSGEFSSYWINGVSVGGASMPLVQRSELVDGTFHNTRWNDIFEPGSGRDALDFTGWGSDVLRLAAGSGEDTLSVRNGFYPQVMGEVSLGTDIDLSSLSYAFSAGEAIVTTGVGDVLSIVPDALYTFRDNVFGRIVLSAEADPGWIPEIRAQGYTGNLYGSYGADHLIGNANSETFLPGYGDDIIEAGDGADRIVLNDLYFGGGLGIGAKKLDGGADQDTVETPLHQGLTFHYDIGDGHDEIVYDWSYSLEHPYRFGVDIEQNRLLFQPQGRDILEFGEGIALEDLRFTRFADTLDVALADGSGSIRLGNFFDARDGVDGEWTGSVGNLLNSDYGQVPDSLKHPALLVALPPTPVAALRFADGNEYSLEQVLAGQLAVSEATVLGTGGDDYLSGTEGDDIIDALGGNDYIEEFAGSNVIRAGSGNDLVFAGGDNRIDAGPGDDWLNLLFGRQVVEFGPGSGSDFLFLNVETGVAVVELAAGIGTADVKIGLADTDWGQVPAITLSGTGDRLVLGGFRYLADVDDWEAEPGSDAMSLVFADGTALGGSDLYAMALDQGGETIGGTEGSDVLVGTEGDDIITGGGGDDTMDGLGGDDIFVVEGRRQGRDRIIGGEGYDTIRGGADNDRFVLTDLLLADSIELVDGGGGVDRLRGTGIANIIDLSATELRGIDSIEGRAGADQITGSAGDDTLVGGRGRDTLSGGRGDDTYVFAAGDGRDVIANADPEPTSWDVLRIEDVGYQDVWFSRKRKHLAINFAGTTERVLVRDWYDGEAAQLDAIEADGHLLLRDQVDLLVNAMAAFDVPDGIGMTITEQAREELEPVLAAVWQSAA